MKLFVNKSDSVSVRVYCWEKDGEVEASCLKTDVPQEHIEVVEQVDFTFRKPSYADSNIIIRNSDIKAGGEEMQINVQVFQEQILRALLIDWTIKNEEGNRVPVNNVSINNLLPSVARAAVAGALEKIKI